MEGRDRPPPPPGFEDDPAFDESPEWTEEDFRKARRGAPWLWEEQAERLRAVARDLREQADRLEKEADAIERPDLKKAG